MSRRRPRARVPRGRAAVLLLALLAFPALSGCETTAEKSAELKAKAKRVAVATKGLEITRESTDVKVTSARILKGSERAAAVVLLRNTSAKTLHDVPIAITAKDASGKTVFQNNLPGLEKALVSLAAIAPHATAVWVDDQLPSASAATSVSARVGAAPPSNGKLPTLAVSGAQLAEAPAGGLVATGTITNHATATQPSVVVYALARRGSAIVAAGRGVLQRLAAGASAHFEAFMVGGAAGAKLQVTAPPTGAG